MHLLHLLIIIATIFLAGCTKETEQQSQQTALTDTLSVLVEDSTEAGIMEAESAYEITAIFSDSPGSYSVTIRGDEGLYGLVYIPSTVAVLSFRAESDPENREVLFRATFRNNSAEVTFNNGTSFLVHTVEALRLTAIIKKTLIDNFKLYPAGYLNKEFRAYLSRNEDHFKKLASSAKKISA